LTHTSVENCSATLIMVTLTVTARVTSYTCNSAILLQSKDIGSVFIRTHIHCYFCICQINYFLV